MKTAADDLQGYIYADLLESLDQIADHLSSSAMVYALSALFFFIFLEKLLPETFGNEGRRRVFRLRIAARFDERVIGPEDIDHDTAGRDIGTESRVGGGRCPHAAAWRYRRGDYAGDVGGRGEIDRSGEPDAVESSRSAREYGDQGVALDARLAVNGTRVRPRPDCRVLAADRASPPDS